MFVRWSSADLDAAALTLYYGTVLITKHGKSIEDVVIVESMLLFSIGYVSSVLSWSKCFPRWDCSGSRDADESFPQFLK